MPLAGFQCHKFRVFFSRRPVAYLMVVADSDRIVRVKTYYTAVFYKNTRHTVYGCGDDKFIVEADALCIRTDLAVEVSAAFRAESQMPFAHCSGSVSGIFQHISHGNAGCVDDKFRVSGSNAGVLLPPRIHAGQKPKREGVLVAEVA